MAIAGKIIIMKPMKNYNFLCSGFSLAAAKEGAGRNIKVFLNFSWKCFCFLFLKYFDELKVNVIAPIAGSRMTETVMPPGRIHIELKIETSPSFYYFKDLISKLKPDYVAPFVGYHIH